MTDKMNTLERQLQQQAEVLVIPNSARIADCWVQLIKSQEASLSKYQEQLEFPQVPEHQIDVIKSEAAQEVQQRPCVKAVHRDSAHHMPYLPPHSFELLSLARSLAVSLLADSC